MKNFEYTITDAQGIHARPAGLLVKEVARFVSKTTFSKGDKSADAKRLFAVMGLGVKQGDVISITVDGDDEDAAAFEIEKFLKENL